MDNVQQRSRVNADIATQRALDQFHRAGVSGLTEEERILAAIWCFESKVANGGLENFYKSREGVLAPHAPAAFRAIGAHPLADIAERANAVFGSTGVPAEQEARSNILRALSAEARERLEALTSEYYEYDKDLVDHLERFLAGRPGSTR
jgi:hypothetical protein